MKDNLSKHTFPSTRWSLVSFAGAETSDIGRKALNELLELYYPVLRTFLIKQKKLSHDEAEDVLQDFVLEKILENKILGKVDSEKGKFRNFLLKILSNYLASYFRKKQALKRLPDNKNINLDEIPAVASIDADGENSFNLIWARQIIVTTVEKMKKRCLDKKRKDIWGVFEDRILRPILYAESPADYEDLIKKYKLVSPAQASNILITGKRMFKTVLIEVVRDTLPNDNDIEEEIKELQNILSQ